MLRFLNSIENIKDYNLNIGVKTMSSTENKNLLEKRNDLADFFAEYKWWVIGIILVVVGVVTQGIVKNSKETNNAKFSDKVFLFNKNTSKAFIDKKIKAGEYSNKVLALLTEMKGSKMGVPLVLKGSENLLKNGHLMEAKAVLEKGHKLYSKSNKFVRFLINSRLASIYEDKEKYQDAITLLEELIKKGETFMPGKVHLDLGRLYKIMGNKEKAKGNLQHVVDSINDKELVKLAKIYLAELG